VGTRRAAKRWVYLDAGMFGGIIETTEGLQYEVVTDRGGSSSGPWPVRPATRSIS
jgi:ornithine decarboxylase